MNLTQHFTLEEMTLSQTAARNGLDNTPSESVIENLARLCEFLEEIREVLGAPLIISSGYRSPELNQMIGGAKGSQHSIGCAADFTAKGISLDGTIKAITEAKLHFDQMIREYDSWVHVSVPNDISAQARKQVLIIDKKGTRPYVV